MADTPTRDDASQLRNKNRKTLVLLFSLVIGMFGFGFALVPLYGYICEVAGIQTLDQGRAKAPTSPVAEREIDHQRWVTVKFDSTIHPDLPWELRTENRVMRVRPGEVQEVNFTALNRSSQTVTGQAISVISPWQANAYFSKLECFCFRQQKMVGHEQKVMPLRFTVSPDLPKEINSLTLSYNFLRLEEAG